MESTTWRVVALWAAAVVVAVGASTAAVTLATDSVTQPPAVGLASPSDGTTPGGPTPGGDPSPTGAATAEPSPAVEGTDGSGDGTTAGSGDTPTTESDPGDEPSPVPSPRDDDTDDDGNDDDGQPGTATLTCGERGGQSRSATSVGGRAVFCFIDGDVELVYATPDPNGFTVDVDDEAGEVRVTFTSDDHESRIDADYEDRQPRVRVREEAEDD